MSKLNKDILFLIFEELQDDSKSLFSCLMVNKLWCETVIPILWRNPWYYAINYNKSSLYHVITSYLPVNIKKFLTKQETQPFPISRQPLLFDYLSFCRSINVSILNNIISIGTSSAYNKFLLQREVYNVIIGKCPELKYLNMISIEHQIFYFPEAKARLESLCKLECNTSIDSSYFYGLAYVCQNIQGLIITNTNQNANYGAVKLIEVQKNLKYFEWCDDFDGEDSLIELEDPYTEIFFTLAKHANSLNHIVLDFDYEYDHGRKFEFLLDILSEFRKLKSSNIS